MTTSSASPGTRLRTTIALVVTALLATLFATATSASALDAGARTTSIEDVDLYNHVTYRCTAARSVHGCQRQGFSTEVNVRGKSCVPSQFWTNAAVLAWRVRLLIV